MIDKERLQQLYITEEHSIREIALLEHVPTRTIYDALIHYCIPRRAAGFHHKSPQPTRASLSEAALRQLYLEEQRSIRDIATLYQISTRMVYDALSRYRIPRRPAGQQRPIPNTLTFGNSALSKAALQRLYQEDRQSIAAIAAMVACSPSRIRNALVRWGIARRRRGRHGSNASTGQG